MKMRVYGYIWELLFQSLALSDKLHMKVEGAGNTKENLGTITYTDAYLMMPFSEIGDFGGQPI